MADETLWTPKRHVVRMRFFRTDCARCGGKHTDWWKSTPPPSCEAQHAAQG